MKQLFALIFLLIKLNSFGQTDRRIYKWDELAFANPDTIRAISFEKMKLDSLPADLWKYTNLTYLNLDKNLLSNLPIELSSLTALEEISFSKNKFTFFPLVICQLANLRVIDASRNRIESIPDQIQYCSKLQKLDLYDNIISDFGTGIFNLEKLKTLNVEGVMYGTIFAEALKLKLPNVNIQMDPPCKCLN